MCSIQLYTIVYVVPARKEYKTETASALLFADHVKFYTFVRNFTCLRDLVLARQRHWRIINTIVISSRLINLYKLLFVLTGDACRIESSAAFVRF